jgi:hypothetical protein
MVIQGGRETRLGSDHLTKTERGRPSRGSTPYFGDPGWPEEAPAKQASLVPWGVLPVALRSHPDWHLNAL